MKPEISFVIPCFNSADTISNTIKSIQQQDSNFHFQIIVVDNNSTDDLLIAIGDLDVQLISCETQGAGAARNRGVTLATGEILVFLDADVTLPIDWLQGLVKLFKECPWVDLVAGTVIPASLSHRTLHAFRYQQLIEKTDGTLNFLSANPAVIMPLMNTSLCAIRKQRFDQLGGFNEALLRQEDSHLTYRAIFQGLHLKSYLNAGKVYFSPDTLMAYFKRSFANGRWLVAHNRKLNRLKNRYPMHLLKPSSQVDSPMLELIRIINNFAFYLGLSWASLQEEIPAEVPLKKMNPKNPFYFHFYLDSKTYGLDPHLAIINHAKGINLYHGTNYYSLSDVEHELFLNCFKGKILESESDKMTALDWISKQIFISI